MTGAEQLVREGSVPVFLIELRFGPADGARLVLAIPPPEVWEVAEIPQTYVPSGTPGQLLQVPLGRIRVHRYRRTEAVSADQVARVYRYDLTFP